MKKAGSAVSAAVVTIIVLRLLAASSAGPFWGINFFRYLGLSRTLIISGLALACLVLPWVTGGFFNRWSEKPADFSPIIAAVVFLAAALVFPRVATPLLGDGLDRLEATVAGFKSLAGQPAPLDFVIHILLYKIMSIAGSDPWRTSWLAWRIAGYLAGALAVYCIWKLSCSRSEKRGGRAFIFWTIFLSGTAVFFFGYVENYVILAAAIYGFLVMVELAGHGRVHVPALAAGLVVLVGLHYFMLLLVPVLFFTLYRHKLWRPSPVSLAVLGLVLATAGVLVLLVVREHYRGPAAIFVSPSSWFSSYHLVGFLSQQIIAAPVLPLLIPPAFLRRRHPIADPMLDFAGHSSLVLLIFFFFLRPVIGPAADWDLFAIPSLFFMPWLVLKVHRNWRGHQSFRSMAWSVLVLAFFSTASWNALNCMESSSVARFRELMEWEAGHNTWAASYGYLRLGKYLARTSPDEDREQAVDALDRAIRINPDSATLRLQTARVLAAMGEPDLARASLVEHHLLMAAHEEKEGRMEQAALQFEKAVGLSPGSRRALAGLVRLYEGPLSDPEKARRCREEMEKRER